MKRLHWTKQTIREPHLAPLSPSGTSAQAVRAGPLVFVTGQTGRKAGETSCSGDLKEQTLQVLNNIKAILQEAGTSLDNVVKRNVYVGEDGDAVREAYDVIDSFFPSSCASTTIQATLLAPRSLIEIDVIAIIPDNDEK